MKRISFCKIKSYRLSSILYKCTELRIISWEVFEISLTNAIFVHRTCNKLNRTYILSYLSLFLNLFIQMNIIICVIHCKEVMFRQIHKNQAIAKGIQNINSIDKSLRLMVLLFGGSMYKYINEKFLYS